MSTEQHLDPSIPEADAAAFAYTLREAFLGRAQEINGRGDGIIWKWARRGIWTIKAGAVLDPEPVISGPAGQWRIARMDHAGAVFALLLASAADALPDGVEVPAPSRPPASGVYMSGRASVTEVPAPRPAVRPASPVSSPARPGHRVPGGNTGIRPAWDGSTYNRWPVDGPPPAGMGPGAAYAPEVVHEPGPCPPMAGSDLPPRHEGVSAYEPPAAPTCD